MAEQLTDKKFEYSFVEYGTTCPESRDANEIWLDNGNRDEIGVFDHHCSQCIYESTARMLVGSLERIRETVAKLHKGSVVFKVHYNPDMDALVSIFLMQEYIQKGEEYFVETYAASGAKRAGLIAYADTIDSGKGKSIGRLTLYALIYWLNIVVPRGENKSWLMVKEGLVFLKTAAESLDLNPEFNLYEMELPVDKNDEYVQKIVEHSKEAENGYEMDSRENLLLKNQMVTIYRKDGTTKEVRAFIWKEPPKVEAEYILARWEGADLTFVPHQDHDRRGVRISINPDSPHADDYTLKPLVEIYEQMEQLREGQMAVDGQMLRRDYSRRREADKPDSRFAESPFCNTSDPWFFSEKEDMVDVPGVGTLLTWDELLEILLHHARLIKSTSLIVYEKGDYVLQHITGKGVKVDVQDSADISLMRWKRLCKGRLREGAGDFKLIVAVVDPLLIARSYDVLEAYYADLSESAYIDGIDCSSLHLDRRTHFFCNRKNGILFAASDRDGSVSQMCRNVLSLDESGFLSKESVLPGIIGTVVAQREKLKEISSFLGEFDTKKDKEIRIKQTELIKLNARIQQEDTQSSQAAQEIYDCVKNRFAVEEMRNRITEAMDVVMEYTKEHVYGNLNFLSMVTVPYIIISTLFQIGMIQFSPLVVSEENAWRAWGITLILVAGSTVLFYFVRRRK